MPLSSVFDAVLVVVMLFEERERVRLSFSRIPSHSGAKKPVLPLFDTSPMAVPGRRCCCCSCCCDEEEEDWLAVLALFS